MLSSQTRLVNAPNFEAHNRGAESPRTPAQPPIRVLLIAPSLNILGGQAVQAERLLNELKQDPSVSIDFFPIAPLFPGPFSILQKIPYIRTVLTFLYYLPWVAVKLTGYEILHIFSASYWSYALWSMPPLLLGRLLGKKVILNYRSGEAPDHLRSWRTAAPTIRWAHEVISPSEYLVDVFAEFGIRCRTIPNVLDTAKLRFRQRRKLRPVFLTHRGMEPLYNIDCVLRAFQIVQERYPEASLTLANDGSSRPHLEALARELGLRNTRFVGRVPQHQIAELYDSADIYLMSPDLDCMPGTVLECYALGIPFISTNAGGIPYIVEHEKTGFLVACNDHQAMAAYAIRLLEDEELVARLTHQGYQELTKYTGETVRTRWVELYRELVGR